VPEGTPDTVVEAIGTSSPQDLDIDPEEGRKSYEISYYEIMIYNAPGTIRFSRPILSDLVVPDQASRLSRAVAAITMRPKQWTETPA
jgi:hypothetical protein